MPAKSPNPDEPVLQHLTRFGFTRPEARRRIKMVRDLGGVPEAVLEVPPPAHGLDVGGAAAHHD